MISAEQIVEIRRHFFVEHWKIGTIAAQLHLHPITVANALETHRFRRGPSHRPSLTDPFLSWMQQTLQAYPRLRASRLYQMLVPRGYRGSLVQLRRVVATLRPLYREAFLRLHPFPAEQAQVDWASFGKVTIGRAQRSLSAFLLTLSHSRALWLEFFLDQSLDNFCLGHIHAFRDWQGVPKFILCDNLRSVVTERHGDLVHFHPKMLELAAHYHFAFRPCRPARGNEKGRVERAIQYVRSSFFPARSFSSLEDFNRQALQWRDQVAHQRRWPGDDALTVTQALAQEQPQLIPLPQHPFDAQFPRPVRSGKTPYVRFDLNDYSIPAEAVGRPLTLLASPDRVRIVDGLITLADHPRSYDRHQSIDHPDHFKALLEQKQKARTAAATTRLALLVPESRLFLQEAFQCGESIPRTTKQLTTLLDDYGAPALTAALLLAQQNGTPRAASVAFLLQKNARASAPPPLPVDLSRRPKLSLFQVSSTPPEVYDALSHSDPE